MTLRIINDDPRCRSQQRCALRNWRKNSGICNTCAREIKLDRARAALEKHKAKQVPAEFKVLYKQLVAKVSAKEAHRMINIEMKRAQKRMAVVT